LILPCNRWVEIQRFFKQTGRVILPLTVRAVLNEEIATRLV